MSARAYLIPSMMLDVHRMALERSLGDLLQAHPEVFFHCTELLVCTCHNHSGPMWYLDYYDQFINDFYGACGELCVKNGLHSQEQLEAVVERAIVDGTLWRAYEGLARYVHRCIRACIPRGYKALEIRDVDRDGLNMRLPIYAEY